MVFYGVSNARVTNGLVHGIAEVLVPLCGSRCAEIYSVACCVTEGEKSCCMGSLRGRGPLLCRPRHHPDSYSRIVALSHGGFVLSGSFAWWRLLSFPDGILLHRSRPGLQPWRAGSALLCGPRCVDSDYGWDVCARKWICLVLCHWVAVLDNRVPDDVHLQRSWP